MILAASTIQVEQEPQERVMSDNIVVQSKVKEYISGEEMRTSGELIDALNEKVNGLLDAAIARCKANGRATVKPEDL